MEPSGWREVGVHSREISRQGDRSPPSSARTAKASPNGYDSRTLAGYPATVPPSRNSLRGLRLRPYTESSEWWTRTPMSLAYSPVPRLGRTRTTVRSVGGAYGSNLAISTLSGRSGILDIRPANLHPAADRHHSRPIAKTHPRSTAPRR